MLFRHPLVHDEIKGTRALWTRRRGEKVNHIVEIILNQTSEDNDQTLLHSQDLRTYKDPRSNPIDHRSSLLCSLAKTALRICPKVSPRRFG